MVFELCDWQYPSTILGEWDHDDEIALEELRTKAVCKEADPAQHPATFQNLVNDAEKRVTTQQQIKQELTHHQRQ